MNHTTQKQPRARILGSALAATLVFLTAAGSALGITQPDGTTIPVIGTGTTCSDKNVQACLNQEEGQAGLINAIADARIIPETFEPFCDLKFKVVARGAGFKNVFGWYNVTGSKPTNAQHHAFLLCGDGVGTIKTLNIRDSPYYTGGKIGFFMATPEGVKGGRTCPTFLAAGGYDTSSVGYLYYSEWKYNPDATRGSRSSIF